MGAVDIIIDDLIAKEGGYVNHPSDKGGATHYGITERVARANGYRGPMQDLSKDEAKAIYLSEYWRRPSFDKVHEMAPMVGIELLDCGVLSGTATAGRWLQICLNRMNAREKLYKDLKVDGSIGPVTLGALSDFMRHRRRQGGEKVLTTALNVMQGHHLMITAPEHHKPNEDFVFGWIKNRVRL
jgi:typhoid toxin secretion A